VYTAFLIYAGGIKYLLLSALLYAPGTLLYVRAAREQNRSPFNRGEWLILLAVVAGFVAAVAGLATGRITL
jgi:arginine:ornithine antiporter/lysine permease